VIVDSHTVVGFWPREAKDLSPQALLRLMQRHGVDRACVTSARAFVYDFVEGNQETLEICAAHEALLPGTVIDPRRFLECRDEIASARDRGFRLFRLFPDEQGWTADSPAFTRLLPDFAEAGLPVAAPSRIGLGPLLRAWGDVDLPLILSGVTYWDLADVLAMMEAHPRVCLDTSLLNSPGAIELICERFGAERVLFGSGALLNEMAPALETVRQAQVSEAQRALILGGNATRLFGVSRKGRRAAP
jgi:hypothetical protein